MLGGLAGAIVMGSKVGGNVIQNVSKVAKPIGKKYKHYKKQKANFKKKAQSSKGISPAPSVPKSSSIK